MHLHQHTCARACARTHTHTCTQRWRELPCPLPQPEVSIHRLACPRELSPRPQSSRNQSMGEGEPALLALFPGGLETVTTTPRVWPWAASHRRPDLDHFPFGHCPVSDFRLWACGGQDEATRSGLVCFSPKKRKCWPKGGSQEKCDKSSRKGSITQSTPPFASRRLVAAADPKSSHWACRVPQSQAPMP